MRRWLFAVVCLATLIGLFYAVEDWRGKRAWEKCRRELEAKGAVLDWNAFIPRAGAGRAEYLQGAEDDASGS